MRLLLLALAALALASAPALGETLEAGASGQCYDDDGNGGQDEARAAVDTDAPASAAVTAPSVTGAAAAVAELATSPNQHCENDDTLDYAEADARAGGTTVQVCYDGAVLTDGSCPTSPAGPGQPG
jgi:hypothetical protein